MAEPFVPSDYSGIAARFGSYQNYAGIGKETPFGKTFSISGDPSTKSMYDVSNAPAVPAATPQTTEQFVAPPAGTVGQPPTQFGAQSSPFALPTFNLPSGRSMLDAVKKHLGEF